MKIFVDTNIVLDLLMAREGFHEPASILFDMCERHAVEGYASPLTFCNAGYVLRKALTRKRALNALKTLSMILTPVDLTASILTEAFAIGVDDLDDAVQILSAQACGAEAIITRDATHFASCGIRIMTATEFVSAHGAE